MKVQTTEHCFSEAKGHLYESQRLDLLNNLHTQLGMTTSDACECFHMKTNIKKIPGMERYSILYMCTFIEETCRFDSTVPTDSDT